MGRLATPTLFAGALSPWAGAFLIDAIGPNGTVGVLVALAIVNVVFALALAQRTEWGSSPGS
jgi:hypothetical protein